MSFPLSICFTSFALSTHKMGKRLQFFIKMTSNLLCDKIFMDHQRAKSKLGGNLNMDVKTDSRNAALKRWYFFAIFWPLACFLFAGIIISQPGRGTDEYIADVGFTIIPLVFFAIGMRMRLRLLKERLHATVLTKAVVVAVDRKLRVGEGNSRSYFPQYEFQAGEKQYRVKSRTGYGRCYVETGQQVDLYYAPENPNLFYVPIIQKHDKRWALLLCGMGVAYPLIGLFAPQIRALFSFLP